MSISESRCAVTAATSFFNSAERAATACSAPLSRSVSVSRCASRTKAASQDGRPSGRSRPIGRASDILHAVLLPDALARLGSHRPVVLGDSERDLLEVFL